MNNAVLWGYTGITAVVASTGTSRVERGSPGEPSRLWRSSLFCCNLSAKLLKYSLNVNKARKSRGLTRTPPGKRSRSVDREQAVSVRGVIK